MSDKMENIDQTETKSSEGNISDRKEKQLDPDQAQKRREARRERILAGQKKRLQYITGEAESPQLTKSDKPYLVTEPTPFNLSIDSLLAPAVSKNTRPAWRTPAVMLLTSAWMASAFTTEATPVISISSVIYGWLVCEILLGGALKLWNQAFSKEIPSNNSNMITNVVELYALARTAFTDLFYALLAYLVVQSLYFGSLVMSSKS
eukprot:TRINITY_DN10978_c0_g1_i1.p1 TRINITY_DN10978_c0_g1~~TRINITY_DN10978_c0_g1_i1.p1  ORF type:complete len:205 (+),score=13.21 TRINITY_DN10978_c0_g1_i1:35-649(+)